MFILNWRSPSSRSSFSDFGPGRDAGVGVPPTLPSAAGELLRYGKPGTLGQRERLPLRLSISAMGNELSGGREFRPVVGTGGRPETDSNQPWILIVEDDAVFRLLLTKVAGMCDCRAHAVGTVQAALDQLSRAKYSLVLLDCHLPDGHGSRVAGFATSPSSKGPARVVGISSDDSPENVTKMFDAGVERFLVKPVSIADLITLVRSHTSLPGTRHEP